MDLVTISVVGGLLGSIPVAVATVALTVGAVRFDWDLDNLVAPTVSTFGDIITIPALWLAATWLAPGDVSFWLGVALTVVSAGVVAVAWRAAEAMLRQIFRESLPVLTVALVLSTFAGIVLQRRLSVLEALPALFVVLPAFVSTAGALGGILAGRVATNLHLGSVEPTLVPGREVRRDAWFLVGIAVPVFLLDGAGAWLAAGWQGDADPALGWTVLVTMLAAAGTMAFVLVAGYFATIGAWRVEVDPDSYGTPLVTSSVDFVGALTLVTTAVVLGLA